MERDPNLNVAENAPDFSLMERLRNSRLGMFVTAGLATLSTVGAGELAMNAASVSAENPAPAPANIDPSLQPCVDHALALPNIPNWPTMRHAGNRPLDKHRIPQIIRGGFEYPDITAYCPPEYQRVSKGQIQMQEPHGNHWRWRSLTAHWYWVPGFIGNQEGRSTILYMPTHPWPDYAFDQCINGKFGKVRDILTNKVVDQSSRAVLVQKQYTLPIPVKGSCAAARASDKATQKFHPWSN